MTTYVLKATMQEADDIVDKKKAFIFRGAKTPYGFGDEIQFQVIANGQMKRHAIEKMKFLVTYISTEAPIERGFKVIGFRQIR